MALLDKISALLNQAQNTDNENEAATFMEKAQALATQSGIELAVARAHQASKERRTTPEQKTIKVGIKGQHGLAHFVELASAIARNNDVQLDLARNNTYVIAYGFPSDIEVVEALFASLLFQMESACSAFIKSGVFKNETVEKYDYYKGYTSKPVHGSSARKSFQEHFVYSISDRLSEARRAAKAAVLEAAAEVENVAVASSSTALVLLSKEVEVKDFYKSNSRARGSWKGATSGNSSSGAAAGRTAGQRANLGGQKSIGGSRVALSA